MMSVYFHANDRPVRVDACRIGPGNYCLNLGCDSQDVTTFVRTAEQIAEIGQRVLAEAQRLLEEEAALTLPLVAPDLVVVP